jgi:hypothetical protein
MSVANPRWGAPRMHGELLKLGIDVSQATVGKYMVRQSRPFSQTWRAFLHNHLKDLVSTDFFVVPTLNFRILFVFVVLAHHRRPVVHFNITAHPRHLSIPKTRLRCKEAPPRGLDASDSAVCMSNSCYGELSMF